MGAKPSKRGSMKKGAPTLESGSAPLAASMLGAVQGAGPEDEEDEESGSDQEFDEPLCALVQNCTMLHNIVGPACIFLRQGLAQAQLSSHHDHLQVLPPPTNQTPSPPSPPESPGRCCTILY